MNRPLGRRLLNEPVVIFRDESGTSKALREICSHKLAPLSLGRHLGNRIECSYHGLRFAGNRRCVHNPHGKGTIPKSCGYSGLSRSRARLNTADLESRRQIPLFAADDSLRGTRVYIFREGSRRCRSPLRQLAGIEWSLVGGAKKSQWFFALRIGRNTDGANHEDFADQIGTSSPDARNGDNFLLLCSEFQALRAE